MALNSLRPRLAVGALAFIAVSSLSLFIEAASAAPPQTPYQTGRANSGTPNSTNVTKDKNGVVISYGNGYITYNLPPAAEAALGQQLYQQNCASCHGDNADGKLPKGSPPGTFPSLLQVGSAAIDFWIESGRMPASGPRITQPIRKPQRLDHNAAVAIAAWVDSLNATPSLPYIPTVNLTNGNVANGAALFALNCAACHTITGDGDALAFGTYSPPIRHVSAVDVVEAIRTGPGNMPRFSGNLSDQQITDIVKYVTLYIEHPKNPGGFGLGGLGPVAEGFVGLSLGVGILALAGFWVGERE